MPYEFRDDIARADVAFDAAGSDLKELFVSAGLALENVQVSDLSDVHTREMKLVEVQGEDVEKLLHNFLQELIFYRDAELLLFGEIEIEEIDETHLKAVLHGERIDMEKHELGVEVKAVTWHMFEVEETGDGWRATVVLDV